MADRIPLRLVTVSGVPTIGEFQSGDTVGLVHGGTGVSSLAEFKDNLGLNDLTLSGDLEDVAVGIPGNDIANRQSLVWNGNNWENSFVRVSELRDVANVGELSSGHVLIYNDSVNAYIPRNLILDDLSGVDASSASDNDVLIYDSLQKKWIVTPLTKIELSVNPYTKGNMLVADGSSYVDLGRGTNGQVLIASAGASLGVYWDDNNNSLSGLDDTTFTDLSANQIIVYDGTSWVNEYNDKTEMRVRNGTASAMSKGDVIAIEGAHNANLVNVILADASQTSAMPALGILEQDLAVGEEGIAITFGKAQGLNTSAFTEGATAYVSPTTPGTVTETKPTDTDHLIQNIGIIMRAHASNGAIKVTGIGRANDVDNVTRDAIQYVNTKTHLPQINSSYSGLTAWTEGSGAMTDWDIHPSMEASSNVRKFAPDPFNGSSIVWKAFDDGPHDTQAWEGGFFPTGSAQALDTSKPHRFSVFIKQHDNIIGSLYMGPHTTGNSAWAVVNQVTGSHNTNPYFEAGDNPEVDEWYLWVGFINASGTTTGSKNYDDLAGMYAMDGTRTNNGFDEYTFSSTATNQSLRAFYYSDSANDAQIGASFWAPRIDALDGSEPTIEDLLRLINTNGGGVSDHGALTGLSDDDHTQYALVDGTRNLQTQTISDTYTGTVGDTSIGYGIETAGNLVNKAGNYLLLSATTGYQFRKNGSTTYTDTDFPQSCRDWDSTYNTVLNSSSTWGGGGTSVQTPIVSGQVYHYRENFANSINNRDTEFGTFWVAGGGGVTVDVNDYNFDTRSSIAATINSSGDRWTYWPMGNFLRTANVADGDEMLLEARVQLQDSTGTGGGITIGFVDWDGNNSIAYNTAPPSDATYNEDHVNMHFDIAHTNVQTAQLDSGGGSTPTVTDLGASYPMSDYEDVWFRPAVHMKYNATSTNWDVQFYINGTAVGSPYSHSLTGSILPFIGAYYGAGASNTFVFRVDWFDVQFQIGDDSSEAYLDMTTL